MTAASDVACHECGDPYWLCMDNPNCPGDFGDHNDDLVCSGCRRGNCRGACQR